MNADLPKTRAGAIGHLMGLSYQVAGEFCVGKDEEAALDAETRAALHLLGVTDEEIDATDEEDQ